MNIWVKTARGNMTNLSNVIEITSYGGEIQVLIQGAVSTIGKYTTDERAKEVIQLIQDHINAIGTNNFNNLPMVFEMPIE